MPELDGKKRIIDYETVNNPDENYYVPVDNGTEGTGKVSVKMVGPSDMISDQYSDSSTYKVGDLCIHNNKLYVCTVAINTPHAFNLSEWELDTLGNYASQIKQSLSDLEDSLEDSYTNLSLNSSIVNTIYIRNIFKFGNIKIANVGYLSKAISTLNTWYELCTLPTGYENLHALEFQWFTRDKKSINIKVENNKIWIVARESVGNNDLINVYIPFI